MVCFKIKVGIIQDWCWSHTPNVRVGGLLLFLLLTLVCLRVTVGISNIGVVLTRRTVGSADYSQYSSYYFCYYFISFIMIMIVIIIIIIIITIFIIFHSSYEIEQLN